MYAAASWMSLGIIVTHLVQIAHKFSSKRPTRQASLVSCKAPIAALWKCRSVLRSLCNVSQQTLEGKFASQKFNEVLKTSSGVPQYQTQNNEVSSLLQERAPSCKQLLQSVATWVLRHQAIKGSNCVGAVAQEPPYCRLLLPPDFLELEAAQGQRTTEAPCCSSQYRLCAFLVLLSEFFAIPSLQKPSYELKFIESRFLKLQSSTALWIITNPYTTKDLLLFAHGPYGGNFTALMEVLRNKPYNSLLPLFIYF